MQLFPYQEPIIPPLSRILEAPDKRLAILNGGTGLGKTYVSLELIRRARRSCLVLCPKVTLGQWKRSAADVGIEPKLIINPEKLRTGNQRHVVEKLSEYNWNWNLLNPGDVVILDESQRYNGYDSQLAYMAANLSRYPVTVLMLTATLADSPLKMRLILHLSRLVAWKSFFQWASSVGCFRDQNINGHPWRPPYGRIGVQVMSDLNAKLFPEFGVRVRTEDIPDFPEVQNIVDLVTPSPKAQKEIAMAYLALSEELRHPDRAKNDMTRLLRWRQRIEMEKLTILRELVEDALEDGYSVVASFNFTDSLFAFKKLMSRHDPAMIYGSDDDDRQQKTAEREAEKARFQTNATRLMLLTIQAGGVGLSLGDELGGHPRVAFHNLPLNTVDLVQLLGRIHRADSKTKSVNRIVLVDGVPVEEKVFKILSRKVGNLSALQNDAFSLDDLIKE